MTENILYNRIECLSDREEDKRDYTLSLMCKILHMEPRSCSDKDKEKQMEYIISHAANLSPKALLAYCTYVTGGMYREQFNYLGLYVIREKINELSYTRTRISQANNLYSAAVGGTIIDVHKNPENESTYYYCNGNAAAAISSSLTLEGNLNFKDIASIISTHDDNLEHACGVNDFYAYVLGNHYYPTMFYMENEAICNYGQKYFIADGVAQTTLQSKVYNDKESTTMLVPYIYRDYVETDTGSQRADVIADKLSNYTEYLINLCGIDEDKLKDYGKSCKDTDKLSSISDQLALNSLILLNHPKNLCGTAREYGKMDSNTAKEKGKKKNDNIMGEALFISTWASLFSMPVYRFFTAAIRSLSIDEFYDKVNIIFPNNSNEPAVIECYNGIYAKLLTAIDDIDTYIKDYESNIPSNYSVFDLYGFLNNSEENKTASAYEKKYMHMVSNYRSRRDIVLNKSFKALFNNKDRKKAGMLKNLCRLGFSIFNVFGGDMYRTYLAAKPQFTGAYRWLVQILSDNHITDECVHKFINHDNLNITYVLPSKLYAFNKVDNFVLRNYFPAHDLAGNALDIFFEDVSVDYGACIRCATAIYASTKIKFDNKTLLFIMADNLGEAYKFIAKYISRAVGRTDEIMENNLSYAFIVRDEFISYISDMTNGIKDNVKLYTLNRFYYYETKYSEFTDNGGADHDFPEYFDDAIDKEKFSVTYEKDFDNMLSL